MRVFLLASLLSITTAFMVGPSHRMVGGSTQLSLMSESESSNLLNKVEECAESECSVDQVSDLIDVLHDEQKELNTRVEKIRSMIKTLKRVNGKDNREVDQVRETIRAIFRVFQLGDEASGNDYPSLTKPTGYPGEVGDGPTTAYDCLSPSSIKKQP